MASEPKAARGRPRDPAVDRAVLAAALELLDTHGYDGLKMADVAAQAGAGLGSLYRRWPTKRDLILAAFRSLAPEPASSPDLDVDAAAGLLAILREINAIIGGPEARGLFGLLVGPDRELAAALREAKLGPQLQRLRLLLELELGNVSDLELRTELGPALLTFRSAVLGKRVTDRELREQIVPRLLRPSQ